MEQEPVETCDCGQFIMQSGIAQACYDQAEPCKDCCDGYACTYGCETCFCGCHD